MTRPWSVSAKTRVLTSGRTTFFPPRNSKRTVNLTTHPGVGNRNEWHPTFTHPCAFYRLYNINFLQIYLCSLSNVRRKAIAATKFAAGLGRNKLRYKELSRKISITDVMVMVTLQELTYVKAEAVILTR
jgi:hypothetical protein